jgi:hypothetical protein
LTRVRPLPMVRRLPSMIRHETGAQGTIMLL